ncbi:PH domain-containing protein [Salinibacterium sp. SYSU T00001]|uniref:PH domain-containing protein n=1 Tax=Homoserinimonas sedimenticola TaxID=2986805 RepID=UPI0022359F08|nr:PH domain-containing protein [Salinibacterium sedimenticola]MCW4385403.1 PH domain-containing protein [Salinibacterium sedimenticola]
MTTHLDPPGIQWRRVSSKYIAAELLSGVLFWGVVIAVALVLYLLVDVEWAIWVVWGALAFLVLGAIFTARQVRAYGYQLRDDDLVVRRGIMFLRVVSVPYGRMQLVDINRGPLMRWLGLSELKFVTAAAASAVVIPGLPEFEAEALRDRLVELAESRRAGL